MSTAEGGHTLSGPQGGRWQALRGSHALSSQQVLLLSPLRCCSGLSPQHAEAPGLAPGTLLGRTTKSTWGLEPHGLHLLPGLSSWGCSWGRLGS